MKTDLRYQNGSLYEHHGAWYVRYRQRISKEDGSYNLNHASKHLGRSKDFHNISDVELCRASFMQTHIRDHVGELHLREFRTVDASRMLRAIAKANDLTTTTLQHIKSVLSTIFTYAKNEGAFDGANPVDGVLIPRHAKEPGETHAYDLGQVLQLLDRLPLLEKSLVATAALAGLRQGELRGLEWTDYTGTELVIKRSIWMSVVNLPKTRASRDSVPVIPALAEILDEYRRPMGSPETGTVFHSGDGLPICVDRLGRQVIRRALEAICLRWYGWHAFRRGLASNLYEIGAQDKVVQRILRHSKPHVTRERYIKVFDRTVLDAVEKIQARIEELRQAKEDRRQLELKFGDNANVQTPRMAVFHPSLPSSHRLATRASQVLW